jgi:hypothetical protein
MFLECGQKYPIAEQQSEPKRQDGEDTRRRQLNSNSIGVVQSRNYWGYKLKPLKPQSPLEDELAAKGILLLIVNSI